MKQLTNKLLGFVTILAATANLSHADVILLKDNFESGTLSQWTGKIGAPHQGVIVVDPLNPANHVLTFTGVNSAGDIFSAAPLNVSRPRHYVLRFDFLGKPSVNNPFLEVGGFIGIADAPTAASKQFWVGGTYALALTAPPEVATTLVADGQWHHYEIDFTKVVVDNGLTNALVMLEDWFNLGGVPGDALFDNLCVVGVFDIQTVLAHVSCDGPELGKKWRNHGQYVSTVGKIVGVYLAENIITESEANEIMDAAGRSNCGKQKR